MKRLIRILPIIFTFALATSAHAQWKGGTAVFTQDGVEITVHPGIFVTFALLNGAGYNEDNQFGPPPLKAPKFSKTRAELRDRLGRPGAAAKQFSRVINRHSVPAAEYVKAAAYLSAPKFETGKKAPALAQMLANPVKTWFGEEGGANVYRKITKGMHSEFKKHAGPIEKLSNQLRGTLSLGDEEEQLLNDIGPKGRVTLAFNELDAHGTLIRARAGDHHFVVVGPKADMSRAHDAVAVAFARTLMAREMEKGVSAVFHNRFKALKKIEKAAVGSAFDLAGDVLGCAALRHIKPKATCPGPASKVAGFDSWVATAKGRIAASAKSNQSVDKAIKAWMAP